MRLAKGLRFHRSILFWMIFIFAACLVPMGFAMINVYQHSMTELEKTVAATRDMETQHYAETLGEEILSLRRQQYECITNESVRRLATAQGDLFSLYDESQLIKTVHLYLLSKLTSSTLIESITLYLPRHESVILTVDYYRPWQAADAAFVDTLITQGENGIMYTDSIVYLWASYPFLLQPKKAASDTFIVTTIKRDQFSRKLRSYVVASTFAEMAIRDRTSGTILAATYAQDAYGAQDLDIPLNMTAEYDVTGHARFEHEGVPYQISWSPIPNTQLALTQITPLSMAHRQLIDYRQTVLWIVIMGIGCSVIGIALLYLAIYRPLRTSRQAFRRTRSGDLSVRLPHTWSLEFGEWFEQFNQMVADLETLIEREYQFRLLASNAELKQLQYQISPHFLYNTYFILRGLLQQEELEKAANLADLIGQYLQYIVRTRETFAPLRDELRHAGAYSQIQQLRFGERIRVVFPQDTAMADTVYVPRLTLQPLIENAFEHGLKNKAVGGLVRVSLQPVGDAFLDIVVEDNGEELTDVTLAAIDAMSQTQAQPSSTDSGIALYNIHRRIQIAFGAPCGLRVSRSALGGLCCTARISLHTDGHRLDRGEGHA